MASTRHRRESGAAQIEELVLVVTVALGAAAAAVPLVGLTAALAAGIEWVLALPLP